jgi:chromosome segregation ATPase
MVQETPHFIGESMQEEILKEMEKYPPVLTFADIIRALRSHPEWLEELRKLILTEELLELPKKFDELLKRVDRIEENIKEIKQDVGVLKQDVDTLKQDVDTLKQDVTVLKQDVAVLKQDVAILKQDVAILKQEVAILKQDVAYLKGEFGRFKGKDFERTIRERYYAYFGRLLRKTKLIPMEDLLLKLDELEESGVITEEERMSILQVDIVLRGEIKSTKKAMVLAVEVSYSLFEDDLARAEEHARILAHVLKEEVIPCVVTVEVKEDVEKMADEKGILVIKADY